jgi:enediyne biosynthesis thioesterase
MTVLTAAGRPTVAWDAAPPTAAPVFRYRHVVSFEETNLVGNTYFSRHLSWQGRCRELFLRQHAPSVLDELTRDLRLVTLRVECDYYAEIFAFDEIDVEMSLDSKDRNRIGLAFSYWRSGHPRELVARGRQLVGCMRLGETGLQPAETPPELETALRSYHANQAGQA